jgi:hypothetical protein
VPTQTAVRLSALRIGSAFLPRNFVFLFLVLVSVRPRTHREATSRGKTREMDTCACLVWRQPRGEPTPVGFLTCSLVPCCEFLALTGLPQQEHYATPWLPRMDCGSCCLECLPGCYPRQLTVEAASQCAYTALEAE